MTVGGLVGVAFDSLKELVWSPIEVQRRIVLIERCERLGTELEVTTPAPVTRSSPGQRFALAWSSGHLRS